MSSRKEEDFRRLTFAQAKERFARFEERVSDAQRRAPPTLELVRNAIHRKGAPRCPSRIRRLSVDIVLRHGDALADLFCEYPEDTVMLAPYEISVGFQPPEKKDRIDPLRVMTESAQWTDEWGIRWGHAFGGVGATPVDHPLNDWAALEDFLGTLPDPNAPGRLDAAKAGFAPHRADRYCAGFMHLALFERLHCLRGMENVFLDLVTNEREVRRLCDAIVGYDVALIRRWADTGAHGLFLTDDWGTQTSLMVSLDMWRSYFSEHYRRIFAEIHAAGMDVLFHSCGNITAIIPDLIELGADVIDPLQPGAMDPARLAREVGGRVAFCGGIDDQRLASQSPAEIREEVRRLLATIAEPFGNAFIAAPANIMTPEIPLENIRALFAACHAG
jgi:uroporphyrinogen decarboxylase